MANNTERLTMDAMRKEVNEKFAETDALFIGMQEYSKRELLTAFESKDPMLMSLLVDPTAKRIKSRPDELSLMTLYAGAGASAGASAGAGSSAIGNEQMVNLTINALSKEVKTLGPKEKFYMGGQEYSRDQLLLALEQKDPVLMQNLVIPASKMFGKDEYRHLLLGYLEGGGQQQLGIPLPEQSQGSKRALLINPRFDRASEYSYRWSTFLPPVLRANKWSVVSIGNRNVSRGEVERAIRENNPQLVIFYDHGKPAKLMGSRAEAVFDIGNADLLKDRDVYTVACLSAIELGKECVRKGCRMFWGESKPIMLTTTWNWTFRRHLNDGILMKIMFPSLTWDDCFDHEYKLGDDLVKFLLGKGRPLEASSVINNNSGLTAIVRGERKIKAKEEEKKRPPCFGIFSGMFTE